MVDQHAPTNAAHNREQEEDVSAGPGVGPILTEAEKAALGEPAQDRREAVGMTKRTKITAQDANKRAAAADVPAS